jgi:hypothetical protein
MSIMSTRTIVFRPAAKDCLNRLPPGIELASRDIQRIVNLGAARQFGDGLVLALQFGVPF